MWTIKYSPTNISKSTIVPVMPVLIKFIPSKIKAIIIPLCIANTISLDDSNHIFILSIGLIIVLSLESSVSWIMFLNYLKVLLEDFRLQGRIPNLPTLSWVLLIPKLPKLLRMTKVSILRRTTKRPKT